MGHLGVAFVSTAVRGEGEALWPWWLTRTPWSSMEMQPKVRKRVLKGARSEDAEIT